MSKNEKNPEILNESVNKISARLSPPAINKSDSSKTSNSQQGDKK